MTSFTRLYFECAETLPNTLLAMVDNDCLVDDCL